MLLMGHEGRKRRTPEKLSFSIQNRYRADSKAIHIQKRSSLQWYFPITQMLKKILKPRFCCWCPFFSAWCFICSFSKENRCFVKEMAFGKQRQMYFLNSSKWGKTPKFNPLPPQTILRFYACLLQLLLEEIVQMELLIALKEMKCFSASGGRIKWQNFLVYKLSLK